MWYKETIRTEYDNILLSIQYSFDELRENIEKFFNINSKALLKKSRMKEIVDYKTIFFLITEKQYPQKKIADYLNRKRSGLVIIKKYRINNIRFITLYKNFLKYWLDKKDNKKIEIFNTNNYIFELEEEIFNLKKDLSILKEENKELLYKNKLFYIKIDEIRYSLLKYMYNNPLYDIKSNSVIEKLKNIFGFDDISSSKIYKELRKYKDKELK